MSTNPGYNSVRVMKTSRSIAACCMLFASAAVSASPPSSSPGTDAGSAAPDFRRIVKSATDRVFPAVVYIKVIRESLEEGEKTSQSISGSGVIISCDELGGEAVIRRELGLGPKFG